MNSRPRLIVTEERRSNWNALTWEQRQGIRNERGKLLEDEIKARPWMTAEELAVAMGPLHAHHPDFQERPHSLLHMPNMAGLQPMISHVDHRMRGQIKLLAMWASRLFFA